MRENTYFYYRRTHVLFILSLVFLGFNTTTATSLGHQLVAAAGGADNTCIEKERQALVDFKAQLQDPNGMLSTWRPEEEDDCCQWYGVSCDTQTGHVSELELINAGLGGEVSLSLLNLTYLNYLDLSGNSFHGTIPVFIGSMTHLTSLDLCCNNFSGTIPESIGNMTQLTRLFLQWNIFSGIIPRSIGSLNKLENLDLSHNSFYGTIPPEFGNLTNLVYLSLRSSTVENLNWLSSLSNLNSIDMDGTSLAKVSNWVNVIIGLKNLISLRLGGCDLSQIIHPYSSSANSSSSMVFLYLDNNNLNSSMYRWLCPLTGSRLSSLYLSGNKFDGDFSDFLYSLSGCTSATLGVLDASSNQFTGSLSDVIQNFSSLTYLNLSSNQLRGTITDKLWHLPNLQMLYLSSNSLRGVISENIGKSNIVHIDLSNNSIENVLLYADMSNISKSIEYIDLSSNKLGPHFPKWIKKMEPLKYLDFSNNNISDAFPTHEWGQWVLTRLSYLNLSFNNISGILPDFSTNADMRLVDISSNNLFGPLNSFPESIRFLYLSRNKFHEGISFLCKMNERLEFVDLSRNSLRGQLPDCLQNMTMLTVLNLGHNFLSGRLPSSLGNLFQLEMLCLCNNSFWGELPSSLKNCTKLSLLDLGANKFFGNVPVWIGENLSSLYILSLRSNNFSGTIPLQMCQLVSLQILDLSINNLFGIIPSCVNNLTSMTKRGFFEKQNIHRYQFSFKMRFTYAKMIGLESIDSVYFDSVYIDNMIIGWQGKVNEFSSTLGLVKTIDLSSNNLTGHIPFEITNLHELLVLDLSNNALIGEIPRNIGEMKELLTLNLSRNMLSGEIPSTMSKMDRLNDLDVSYNNLSGRVPSSTQLQSFPSERFTGNSGLCGLPTMKKCLRDEPPVSETVGDGKSTNELWRWFYIGGATGFATAFWIACSALLFNRRLRHAFFRFHTCLTDWMYVKVAVFIARLQWVAHA